MTTITIPVTQDLVINTHDKTWDGSGWLITSPDLISLPILSTISIKSITIPLAYVSGTSNGFPSHVMLSEIDNTNYKNNTPYLFNVDYSTTPTEITLLFDQLQTSTCAIIIVDGTISIKSYDNLVVRLSGDIIINTYVRLNIDTTHVLDILQTLPDNSTIEYPTLEERTSINLSNVQYSTCGGPYNYSASIRALVNESQTYAIIYTPGMTICTSPEITYVGWIDLNDTSLLIHPLYDSSIDESSWVELQSLTPEFIDPRCFTVTTTSTSPTTGTSGSVIGANKYLPIAYYDTFKSSITYTINVTDGPSYSPGLGSYIHGSFLQFLCTDMVNGHNITGDITISCYSNYGLAGQLVINNQPPVGVPLPISIVSNAGVTRIVVEVASSTTLPNPNDNYYIVFTGNIYYDVYIPDIYLKLNYDWKPSSTSNLVDSHLGWYYNGDPQGSLHVQTINNVAGSFWLSSSVSRVILHITYAGIPDLSYGTPVIGINNYSIQNPVPTSPGVFELNIPKSQRITSDFTSIHVYLGSLTSTRDIKFTITKLELYTLDSHYIYEYINTLSRPYLKQPFVYLGNYFDNCLVLSLSYEDSAPGSTWVDDYQGISCYNYYNTFKPSVIGEWYPIPPDLFQAANIFENDVFNIFASNIKATYNITEQDFISLVDNCIEGAVGYENPAELLSLNPIIGNPGDIIHPLNAQEWVIDQYNSLAFGDVDKPMYCGSLVGGGVYLYIIKNPLQTTPYSYLVGPTECDAPIYDLSCWQNYDGSYKYDRGFLSMDGTEGIFRVSGTSTYVRVTTINNLQDTLQYFTMSVHDLNDVHFYYCQSEYSNNILSEEPFIFKNIDLSKYIPLTYQTTPEATNIYFTLFKNGMNDYEYYCYSSDVPTIPDTIIKPVDYVLTATPSVAGNIAPESPFKYQWKRTINTLSPYSNIPNEVTNQYTIKLSDKQYLLTCDVMFDYANIERVIHGINIAAIDAPESPDSPGACSSLFRRKSYIDQLLYIIATGTYHGTHIIVSSIESDPYSYFSYVSSQYQLTYPDLLSSYVASFDIDNITHIMYMTFVNTIIYVYEITKDTIYSEPIEIMNMPTQELL